MPLPHIGFSVGLQACPRANQLPQRQTQVTYDIASEVAHNHLHTLLVVQASPDLIMIELHNLTYGWESCPNETSWRLTIVIYNTYYRERILNGHVYVRLYLPVFMQVYVYVFQVRVVNTTFNIRVVISFGERKITLFTMDNWTWTRLEWNITSFLEERNGSNLD